MLCHKSFVWCSVCPTKREEENAIAAEIDQENKTLSWAKNSSKFEYFFAKLREVIISNNGQKAYGIRIRTSIHKMRSTFPMSEPDVRTTQILHDPQLGDRIKFWT